MEIIVLSAAQYKEKDAVITAITNEDIVTFYARGVFTPTNKNSFLTTMFVKANITLIEGKIAHPILESATLIDSPMSSNQTFEYLSSLMAINEAIFHVLQEYEKPVSYNFIESCLYALKNGINPLHVCLYFFLKILPTIGFGIEVNKCVFCGTKKGIVDFSFQEGGFLCSNCAEIEQRRYTNDQLKLIRNTILSVKPEDISQYNPEDSKVILTDLNTFLDDGLGYSIKSLKPLLK